MNLNHETGQLTAPIIWKTLLFSIILTSILAVVLEKIGVSRDLNIIIGFTILVLVSLFSVFEVRTKYRRSLDLMNIRFSTTALLRLLVYLFRNSKLESQFDLSTAFVSNLLVKPHPVTKKYLAFEFDRSGILTERGEKVLYYVGLSRLFDGENYDEIDTICELMAKDIQMQGIQFDFLVGLLNVGSHIGILLARKMKVPFSMLIKENSKTPDAHFMLRGYRPEHGRTALIFDDTIVSGKTARSAVRNLREMGFVVNNVYGFLDKEYGGSDMLYREGITVSSLIKGEALLFHLLENGILNSDDVALLSEEKVEKRIKNLAE